MTKRELEVALRSIAEFAQDDEFFLIGSQAVHAYCTRPPAEVRVSRECDLYPKNRPETANLLNRKFGRRSSFSRKHLFYIDVVTPELATLPDGWKDRLKPFRAGRVTAYCLEAHDLIASKLAAGRLKDLEFVGALLKLRMADLKTVRKRIQQCAAVNDQPRMRARLESVLDELAH